MPSENTYNIDDAGLQGRITSASPKDIATYFGRPEQSGRGWRSNCPICGRHSLTVTYGHKFSILLKCWHCESNGLNNGYGPQRRQLVDAKLLDPNEAGCRLTEAERDALDVKRRAEAVAIWNSRLLTTVTAESLAGRYLCSRGLGEFIGHPALRCFAAVMIARVWHVHHGLSAIQRTFLLWDGSGRDKDQDRRTKGVLKGAAVWFGMPQPDEEIVIAEGIETCLSAMLLLGAKGSLVNSRAGAAALGPNLADLVLPESVRRIHIAADNDDTGRGAASHAAQKWRAEGRSVRVSTPNAEGADFNDVLMGKNDVLMESRR